MPCGDRIGPLGKGPRASRTAGFWMGLKRLGWMSFMPGCLGGSGGDARQHHRRRHKAMGLARRRKSSPGRPCWGLGIAADWPWA
jgi:hypothetical protein